LHGQFQLILAKFLQSHLAESHSWRSYQIIKGKSVVPLMFGDWKIVNLIKIALLSANSSVGALAGIVGKQ